MSLFSAIDTAISGLSAQSTSFGNISENVANSQTGGFKRIDTSFIDYLTTSTASDNEPGAVVARPDYINNVQGTVTQTDNPTALAITGQGFFPVSQASGSVNGQTTFNTQPLYTRDGNFTANNLGYLVNTSGNYLNAWPVNATTGAVNQNTLVPIQISQANYNPVPTANVSLSANLPATPTAGTATTASPLSSQVTVYDSLGTAQAVNLNWTQNSLNNWTLQIGAPGTTDAGSATVEFGPTASGNAVPAGTIGQVVASATDPGTVAVTGAYAAATPATLTFSANFGQGAQTIKLDLGTYGLTDGVSQFAGTTYGFKGTTQDGIAPGSYAGVSTQSNGNVNINYTNGQTTTVAQVPVVTFASPNDLQSENGQSFTATQASGGAVTKVAGASGAGTLVVQSVEGSNVDIATEFSALIVAQQAYSSNAKVISTANTMLQATLQMVA